MNKAVFLDRDGTINVEKDYLYKIEDFEFLPMVVEALRLLQDNGYLLIVITNQSGIARGYYSEDDFVRLNEWMLERLTEQGINIAKVYYCPHHPNAKVSEYKRICNCRKPSIGLFMQAIREFDIDLDKSYAIGDKIRDCEICKFTRCQGFLIAENETTEIVEKVKDGAIHNVLYAQNLMDAAEEIVFK